MTQHSNGITGVCRSWINLTNLDTRNLTWCGMPGVASSCDARSYLDQLRRKCRDRKYITQYGNEAKKSRQIFSFQICGAYVYLDIEKDWLCEKEHHWFNETCWLRNIKYRRLRLPQFLLQCVRRFVIQQTSSACKMKKKEWKNKEREVVKIQGCIMSRMRHKQNAGENWEKIMEWYHGFMHFRSFPFFFHQRTRRALIDDTTHAWLTNFLGKIEENGW